MSIVGKTLQKIREAEARRLANDPARAGGSLLNADTHRAALPGKHGNEAAFVPGPRILIDKARLQAAGLLPPADETWQIAEQYRQIKRPLIAAAAGGSAQLPNGHVIMIASALPGEGKTFTAVNLAFSMAREKDINVLLVDGDAPKPEISKVFGVSECVGLFDLLQDETPDLESAVLSTDVPGLSLLPAGRRRSEHATELLASERMRALVARLRDRDARRIVLVDSPPLLLTTESRALAAVAGQVVLIVRAAHTAHQTVLDALAYLEGRAVALVLNQNMQMAQGYYHYAYGEAGNARPKPAG
jgi:protein-tyrosine kinase